MSTAFSAACLTLAPPPSMEGNDLMANNRKQPKCQKKIKLVNFLSAAIETWINSYFFRDGIATLYMKLYRALSSLNFHLTGILEAAILIKSQQLKQCIYRHAVLRNLAQLVNCKSSESL